MQLIVEQKIEINCIENMLLRQFIYDRQEVNVMMLAT